MLNKQYTNMLQEKDVIFEIFQYATERAKVVGAENIYDFSLGNPSVPAPSIVNETIVQKVKTLDPLALHGYSPVSYTHLKKNNYRILYNFSVNTV